MTSSKSQKQGRRRTRLEAAESQLMPDLSVELPQDLAVCELLPRLDHKSLLALAATSKHWRTLAAYPPLWQSLFSARWGQQPLNAAAAQLAGSWQAYYKTKHLSVKDATAAKEPYDKPCCFEVDARLHSLASQAILQQHLSCHTAAHAVRSLPTTSPPPCMLLAEQDASSNSTCSSLSYPPSPSHGPGQAAFLSASSSCSTALPSFSSSPSHSSMGFASPTLFAPEELPPAPPPCQILYLIDGSGSVSDEDFGEMRTFVQSSARTLCSRLQGGADNAAAGKVGIIQFSHDPYTELPLTALGDGSDLAGVLHRMARINGGTNIEAALSAASSLFSKASFGPGGVPEGSAQEANAAGMSATTSAGEVHAKVPSIPPARVVILLTDGRVGRYKAHSARAAAKRLLQNLQSGGGCVLAAFGVGRGVECSELVHIIDVEGAGGAEAIDRYLDLFVRDDHGSW
ncbi:hypothetical protein DUNSADRAFT_15013 [Dunaliella salina]|uniref:VWFA domain-containing protein n=1 Tax=Dunaliella salina TaxID=3046 RepID=A0ABQ7G692_DUNSA|nr:hypothetical protein DUNSADRAFT_15013 [Dunaliella salina]|eukprot:KAF5830122.1 hypothetical protein DUNSADRAFT_15013 [Dunaliella salina]